MTIAAAAGVIKPILEILDSDFSAADIQVRNVMLMQQQWSRRDVVRLYKYEEMQFEGEGASQVVVWQRTLASSLSYPAQSQMEYQFA